MESELGLGTPSVRLDGRNVETSKRHEKTSTKTIRRTLENVGNEVWAEEGDIGWSGSLTPSGTDRRSRGVSTERRPSPPPVVCEADGCGRNRGSDNHPGALTT